MVIVVVVVVVVVVVEVVGFVVVGFVVVGFVVVGFVVVVVLLVAEDASGTSKHDAKDKSIAKTRINKTIFFISVHLSNYIFFFVVINEGRTFATHL